MIADNADNNDPLSIGGSFGIFSAAHELKAPNALLRQLALELRETATTDADRRTIDQMVLVSERALRLTTNLTKTARLEDGLFELEPVNVQQLCEEVAYELRPLYAAYERTLKVQSRRRAPLVVANRDLLRRVIAGFADNALRYSDDSSDVVIGVRQRESTVQVSVRDSGPVVTRSAAPELAGRPDSSGLGLAIAARFAEAMHGSTGVRRHRDGMTFFVELHASEQLSLL